MNTLAMAKFEPLSAMLDLANTDLTNNNNGQNGGAKGKDYIAQVQNIQIRSN